MCWLHFYSGVRITPRQCLHANLNSSNKLVRSYRLLSAKKLHFAIVYKKVLNRGVNRWRILKRKKTKLYCVDNKHIHITHTHTYTNTHTHTNTPAHDMAFTQNTHPTNTSSLKFLYSRQKFTNLRFVIERTLFANPIGSMGLIIFATLYKLPCELQERHLFQFFWKVQPIIFFTVTIDNLLFSSQNILTNQRYVHVSTKFTSRAHKFYQMGKLPK